MASAYRIALKARLFRVLCDRPAYLVADRGELIERMLGAPVPLSELERTLVLGANEVDLLCAQAVRTLSHRTSDALLDVLAVLDPERLVAIYYALPCKRRGLVRREPAWAYHVDHEPEDTAAALADVKEWVESGQRGVADRAALVGMAPSRVCTAALGHERLALRAEAGLPTIISEAELDLITQTGEDAEGVRWLLDAFYEELSGLGEPDDKTFASACARAFTRCTQLA